MKAIATSVVRSVQKGESHGGVYLLDLASGSHQQVVSWAELDIDWGGRGKDRGLRGIAFDGGRTMIAASDEVICFDRSFRVVDRFTNPYLRHCHEIEVHRRMLWLTSTGFDSLLGYDLDQRRFTRGLCLRLAPLGLRFKKLFRRRLPGLTAFDPNLPGGPRAGDTVHLNSVTQHDGALYCSGTGLGGLLRVGAADVERHASLPFGTHNARPYRDGVLMNHTALDRVRHADRRGKPLEEWPVVTYDPASLLHADVPRDHARQGFARGLCTTGGAVIAGSSPATVSVYEHGRRRPSQRINLSLDVRNAIHGLEIYPG